jgi:tetratricopeptide (TPR) repeat protein
MADEGHISAGLMRRFLSDEATREEAQGVLAHLIQGCQHCAELAHQLLSQGIGGWYPKPGEPATVGQLADVFARVLEEGTVELRRLAVEKLQGWAQWAALDPLVPEERMDWVLSNPALWTWGLHQRLIEASRWYGRNDPAEGVDIMRLAVAVAERMDSARLGGEAAREDVMAETLALLGNAQRLASEFDGARQSFNEAWSHQDRGTGDPLAQAVITRLEASWMIDMGEFETAEAVLQEAAELCREAGDREQEARTLLKMGAAIGLTDAERGVHQIRQALPLIDAQRQPRTYLCAQHDLAWFLAEAEQSREALEILEGTRRLFRQFPDEYAQLRLHWLEGKIARSMGRLDEAVSIFRQLLDELNARSLKHEIVLVTLDLAEATAAGRQFDEAAKLVRGLYPLMVTWGLHRWALAAWLLLQNALELRQLDGMFVRLRAYYRRYWNREMEFTPE